MPDINQLKLKYAQAVQQEMLDRDMSMISEFDVICGIKVYSLTPTLLAKLTLAKNPIVVGGDITIESIHILLWIIKIKSADDDYKSFCEKVLDLDMMELLKEIDRYFERAMADAPAANTNQDRRRLSYYSSFASLVLMISTRTGWSRRDIMNMPYAELWQYVRIIMKENNPDTILFNKSDSVKKELINCI